MYICTYVQTTYSRDHWDIIEPLATYSNPFRYHNASHQKFPTWFVKKNPSIHWLIISIPMTIVKSGASLEVQIQLQVVGKNNCSDRGYIPTIFPIDYISNCGL